MFGPFEEEKRPKNPRETANILSVLFFIWPIPILYKGYRQRFTKSDIFRPLSTHRAEVLGERLDEVWQEELDRSKKNNTLPNFSRAIFNCFKTEFIMTGIITILFELGIRVMLPLILRKFLIYFRPDSDLPKNDAIFFSILLVGTLFIIPLYVHNYFLTLTHLGMKIRVACCSVIYRKALRASLMALSGVSLGQLVNMLSNDVNRFDLGVAWFHMIWISPFVIIITWCFMYLYLGFGALVGALILFAFLPMLFYYGNKIGKVRANVARLTDERVRKMAEIISAVQIIKMYTWEKQFAKIIENSRRKELVQITKGNFIRGILASLSMYVSRIAMFGCVITYYYKKEPLKAEIIFVVAAYLIVLRQILFVFLPQGLMHCTEAYISIKRIETFLLIGEIDEKKLYREYLSKDDQNTNVNNIAIACSNANAKWMITEEKITLKNINITIEKGKLVAVVGSVGSGKSSFFQLILNELTLLTGTCHVNGKLAYASQEPWLFGGSVRQNILFGLPMNKEKYMKVIHACCLKRDLKNFPFGDSTLVGEKGISLSGGQKARITLARTVYRDADIYLLDDPLSAVDTNVGNKLFFNCISTFLKNKTCLLITHQNQFLKYVDKVIVFNHGQIVTAGTFNEVQGYQEYFGALEIADDYDDDNIIKPYVSTLSLSFVPKKGNSSTIFIVNDVEQISPEEEQTTGNVKFETFKKYFTYGASPLMLFTLASLFILTQVVACICDFFVNLCVKEQNSNNFQSSNKMNTLIIAYTVITIFVIVLTLIRASVYANFCTQASFNLHNGMFANLMESTMRFFNVNPSGRILNRFSKDLGSVDEVLPFVFIDLSQMVLQITGAIVIVVIVNAWLLIAVITIMILSSLVRTFYLPTSQCVKRLDAITRSPIYTYMANTFQGLSTIRAFGKQDLLIYEFDQCQNYNSCTWYLFISLSRFVGFWLDTVSVLLIAAVVVSFLIRDKESNGSDAGLAITQVMGLLGLVQWAVRQSTEFENHMISVERILEYTNIEKEPKLSSKKLNIEWPTQGAIEFKNMSLYYSLNEPPVLNNLTLSINPKEKIGIVGRTGAGKSSLINALFRLAIIDGQILIDGVNTGEISLSILRSNISIIPQQPIVFAGTLRKNLDPFNIYSDANIWKALEEVNYHKIDKNKLNLNFMITEGGGNLSVGERQLLCLARAVLKNNKILVLDEATSNVDPITDSLIQTTIRTVFESCTVLTIAHRLGTIMDSDRVLVLSFGAIVEFDHPFLLLQNVDSVFSSMVAKTGTNMSKTLFNIAEQSYNEFLKKQLKQ